MIREPGKMPKLGFGLMRLPQKDEKIDIQQVCEMVDLYMQAGLCYFDTAYVYHGGKSECAAAEALVEVASTVEPDPELTARYEEQYRKYRKIYPAMKALFPEIL